MAGSIGAVDLAGSAIDGGVIRLAFGIDHRRHHAAAHRLPTGPVHLQGAIGAPLALATGGLLNRGARAPRRAGDRGGRGRLGLRLEDGLG
ncbi:MAG: hypothetical protein ACK55I_45250, partial [bacterium]